MRPGTTGSAAARFRNVEQNKNKEL
ncbi:hypothetical protein SSE37_23024 [Sagittula stellata E-37]|uniref:Uncharacterized protein n=1 Tax=Sagittula stellata (strain ATCC 700073 / DSM 11524 / E-37) TaxID=388399 RepID=A3K050_SAGS3|nr:hypothetical protein SSE37_23024 [Sagittula stellata E-37]